MIFRSIHKMAGILLCLLLCSCSPENFTTIIYVTGPSVPVEETIPVVSPEPSFPAEPSLPPEPSVEPHDYALPVPEREEVADEWFADAVFIGDSRTDGLRLYGGIKPADYICYKGLICRQFATTACIPQGESKITAQAALEKKTYGKVFVMLGLNEIDLSVETFAEDYAALIDQVRQSQPEAELYFQTLIPLNEQKGREKGLASYFTNEKVAQFNAEIVRLAEEKQVLLLDTAKGLGGEEGALPYEATTDGVHFVRSWYQTWTSYIKTHTVDPERLEAAK